jgi:hypothetical protein
MPILSELQCSIAIDVLTRVSLVMMAGLFSVAFCGLMAMPQLTASVPHDRIEMAKVDSLARAKGGARANEMTKSITRSFPVIGEKILRFENLAVRVELVPGKGPTVEVDATVRVGELAEGDVKRLIDDIR